MAFTITFVSVAGDVVLPYTPFLAIKHKPSYNKAEPPTIWGVEETWTLSDAVFLGDEASVQSSYDTLESRIQNRTNQITGVLFKKDGSTVNSIQTSSHTGFKILEWDIQKGNGAWKNHLMFTVVVRGVVGIEDPSGGDSNDVTELDTKVVFRYTPEGYLTKTYTGRVKTLGSSATSKARVIGVLSLPSAYYTYLTNGPEGVDVTTEAVDDRAASFTCTIQEQANLVPTGATVYEVTKTLDKFWHHKMITTNFVIHAATVEDAEDLANDLKPSEGFVGGNYQQIENTTGVRGSWTQYLPHSVAMPIKSYSHTIRMSGGGNPLREITVPGNEAVLVRTARRSREITESITVEYYGALSTGVRSLFEPFLSDTYKDGEPEIEESVVETGLSSDGHLFRRNTTHRWLFPMSGAPKEDVITGDIQGSIPNGGDE